MDIQPEVVQEVLADLKIEAYCYQLKMKTIDINLRWKSTKGQRSSLMLFGRALASLHPLTKLFVHILIKYNMYFKYIIGKIKITELIGLSILCHLMQAGAKGECRRIQGTDGSLQV